MDQRRIKFLRTCLAIAGALAAEPGALTRHIVVLAQGPSAERLTVRPHEMATGTQNAAVGRQTLDGLADYLVYVPKQAVGARRVPLVVMFGGGGVDSRKVMDTDRELADKYGMILFAPNIGVQGPFIDQDQVKALDAGLTQVLRKYAVDPDKIALAGSSNGAHIALDVGCANLNVFTRIAPISPVPYRYHDCGDTARSRSARPSFSRPASRNN